MLKSHERNIRGLLLAATAGGIFGCASGTAQLPEKCACPKPSGTGAPKPPKTPIGTAYAIDLRGTIRDWTVLGPFPNPEQDGRRTGLDIDYLAAIGGETKAVFEPGVQLATAPGEPPLRPAQAVRVVDGHVDFERSLGRLDHSTAYALARLDSEREQPIRFYLGSDDGARVWVNGEPVFRVVTQGRPLVVGQDRFTAKLHPGSNSILVKVEDGVGDWGFVLQAFDERGYQATQRRIDVSKALLNGSIAPKSHWDYMFSSSFPELVWKPTDETQASDATPELSVRWFNAQFVEVKQPSQPGRYMAYAEGHSPNGSKVRRALTFFCRPPNWKPWREQNLAFMRFGGEPPFSARALEEHKDIIADAFGQAASELLGTSERGAALTSYLYELAPGGRKPSALDTPAIVDAEAQLELRRKVLGKPPPVTLRPPESVSPAAPVVQSGGAAQAGVSQEALKRIQNAAREWYEDSQEPFVVGLSRNGVLFYHEAFGKVTKETRFPLASITKFVAGLLLARFIDQGLLQLDDPVGKHLPDWPKEGPKLVTIRQCYTHTSGLGALGDINPDGPWLDNQLFNALDIIEPGKRFEYNGYGYHLAGKIMESITGKSVARLIQEQIFEPIGGTPITPLLLGYSVHSTALDLVRFGQLTLNKGSYGRKKLFSSVTFDALLPRSLHEFYPDLDPSLRVGIGIDGMTDKDPRAGTAGVPENRVLLGPNTIGHGAASSTVFRVDPDHQLVVAVVRRTAGKDYERHLADFLLAVDEAIR